MLTRPRLAAAALTVAALLGVMASAAVAHTSGCHSHYTCPSDHHSYVWVDAAGQGHDCAKPGAPEQTSLDTESITYDGLPYVCHPAGQATAPPVESAPAPIPPVVPTNTIPAPTNPAYSGDCAFRGALPDRNCTPGAKTSATARQVCKPGYATRHRNVSAGAKRAAYEQYGVVSHTAGTFQVDHLISLELGGANTADNLWPQPAGSPGFKDKDLLENKLHKLVCSHRMTLARAQRLERTNWVSAYHQLVGA